MLDAIKKAAAAVYGAVDTRDVILLVGLLLVGFGLAELSKAAALAVPGAVLIYIAAFSGAYSGSGKTGSE